MADQEQISPEAQARKTIDELKGKLAEATDALRQAAVRDRLVEQFAKQGIANPFVIATEALADFKDATAETAEADLAARAKGWLDSKRAIFGVTATTPPTEPTAPVATPSPFSGGTQPNLTAPGLQPQAIPVVVGSKEYQEQWKNKPVPDQIAALRDGTLVIPEKVSIAQREGNPFSR